MKTIAICPMLTTLASQERRSVRDIPEGTKGVNRLPKTPK